MYVEEIDADISLEKNTDGKKVVLEASKISYERFKEQALYGDQLYSLVFKAARVHADVHFEFYANRIITSTHLRAAITGIAHSFVKTLYRRRGAAITEVVTAYTVLLLYELEKEKRKKDKSYDAKDNETEV